MSFGGFLGGAFNALIAPNIFETVVEFPIALALAMALRPSEDGGKNAPALDVAIPVGVGVFGYIAIVAAPEAIQVRVVQIVALGIGVVGAVFFTRAIRLALLVAVAFILAAIVPTTQKPLVVERDFFGVTAVMVNVEENAHIVRHGSTNHGSQRRAPDRRKELTSYYWEGGPLHDVFVNKAGPNSKVAVVGLGAGGMACNAQPGQHWTYFEISPVMIRFAQNSSLFSFLEDCTPDADIILGDARQQLAGLDRTYDLIALDAFSSDSVPVHLITQEAFGLYLDKLEPGGAIVMNVSNRFLDLRPVAADHAAHHGLEVRFRAADPDPSDKLDNPNLFCVFARSEADLGSIASDERWEALEVDPGFRSWTDDYSNILAVLKLLH
jgi:hypothetical protein